MDFHLFPVDEQSCEIKYESFGYTSEQLRFAWRENGSTINPNITLSQFDLNVVLEVVLVSIKESEIETFSATLSITKKQVLPKLGLPAYYSNFLHIKL